MKKRFCAIIALLLALTFVFSSSPVSAAYKTGDTIIGRKITSAEVKTLTDGLIYNKFSYTDSRGKAQSIYITEYNPASTNLRSIAYHKKTSFPVSAYNDAVDAQNKGMKVYAALNADFFYTDKDYGTVYTMYATDGKITVSACRWCEDFVLAVSPDGSMHVTESKISYGLTINGSSFTKQLYYINKRLSSDNLASTDARIYYFDKDIGDSKNPVSDCKEIYVTYTSGKLAPGQSLKGKVKAIKSSGGSSISGNDFILACRNVDISSVKVGDEVVLSTTEGVSASRNIVEKAVTLVASRYVLVHNGVDRWEGGSAAGKERLVHSETDNRWSQYCQRAIVGIKADGTVVYMACDGRNNGNGLNYTQIVELMMGMGCTEVVNYDGGGSVCMVTGDGNGNFTTRYTGESPARSIGNTLLIIEDNNRPEDPIAVNSSAYGVIKDGMLTNAKLGMLTSTLRGGFNLDVTIKSHDGTILSNSIVIATGMVVCTRQQSLTVVVPGDVSGTGKIRVTDYLMAKRIVQGTYNPAAAYKLAADVDGDNKYTATDYQNIKLYFKGQKNF